MMSSNHHQTPTRTERERVKGWTSNVDDSWEVTVPSSVSWQSPQRRGHFVAFHSSGLCIARLRLPRVVGPITGSSQSILRFDRREPRAVSAGLVVLYWDD